MGRRAQYKTPDLFPGFGVVSGNITTNAKLGAAIADEDFTARGPWCAGNRVEALRVDNGVDLPHE